MDGDTSGSHPISTPGAPGSASAQVRMVAHDDLRRSRLTVFFRLLLALPHLVVLALWTVLMVAIAVINWFAVLFTARPVATDLTARYLRYYTHVAAYLSLGANPFPKFAGEEGTYPVELEVPEPVPQNRWTAAFRLILAVPALLLASAFGSVGAWYATEGPSEEAGISFGIVAVAAFLGWFVSLARGRMAEGLRDLIVYGVGYLAQVIAYLLLFTDRYPSSDPLRPRYGQRPPDHPVRALVRDDLRRSRLTVFFRLLLALPHVVWLALWGIVVIVVTIANWFVTLFAGRPAGALHRFVSAYVRYWVHVASFAYIVANPFPGFTGERGSYPVDLDLPPVNTQNRWKTGFRLILAFPAGMLAGALSNALGLVAVFGWFTGLLLGRMPEGLRNLGAFTIRYTAQLWAYVLLLTDRYPFGGPSLELPPETGPPPRIN
jgi:hypothetical protein